MKQIIGLVLFISSTCFGQVVPLPPSVSSVDEIIDSFRSTMTSKIDEMGKNFITSVNDKTILFTNSEKINCNGMTTLIGSPVSSMKFNSKLVGDELSERMTYTGCNDQISLVEDVLTKGKDLMPISYNDFIKGKREFDLKENENFRLYRLSNSDNEELFKMVIEKNKKGKIIQLFIVEQIFVTMNYELDDEFTRLTITYHGYKGQYVRKYSSWSFNRDFAPFNNVVMVRKNKVIEPLFFNTHGGRLSQSEFLTRVNDYLLSGPVARLRKFLEYHNLYFPKTKTVQSGSLNERLKEELRISFNRLQNNTELNLVKKQIQDYLTAAETGLIIDNRPAP